MFPVKKMFGEESWTLVLEEGFQMPPSPNDLSRKQDFVVFKFSFLTD